MITIRHKGDFSKLETFLQRGLMAVNRSTLDEYGRRGVAALMSATPKDTGLTANSWYYEIKREKGKISLVFSNSNIKPGYYGGHEGVPIAVILQYGHASRDGSWVEGIDYINPALEPVFQKMADDLWKEVVGR